MKLKRLSATLLALVMTASTAALAAALPAGWTPADGARMALPQEVSVPLGERYAAQVTVNGKALEPVTFYNYDPATFEETEVTMSVSDIPGAPAGYVPMRLLCAADPNGFTDWFAEENSAMFYLHKNTIMVSFDDLSVMLEGEVVPGVKAYLFHDGVTYLPVDFLGCLPNVEVDTHPEMDTERYDFTLVVSPLMALANTIRTEAGSGAGFEVDLDTLVTVYGVPEGAVEELAAYAPMMTNPDTVFLAKVEPGHKEAVVEVFNAYIQQQIDTFTWYLADQLPKAQNGRVVTEGDYVMLFIGQDSAKAAQLFADGVKAL